MCFCFRRPERIPFLALSLLLFSTRLTGAIFVLFQQSTESHRRIEKDHTYGIAAADAHRGTRRNIYEAII